MKKTSFICPFLWNQLSTNSDGSLRVCCYGEQGTDIKKDGQNLYLDNVGSLNDVINSELMMSTRAAMMKGEVPTFCRGCKKIEDAGGFSPRLLHLDQGKDLLEEKIRFTDSRGYLSSDNLEVIELTLGNQCNLKCRMCSPYFSKKLEDDFKSMGIHYNTDDVDRISRFWNWENKLSSSLKKVTRKANIIKFLGGEPLLIDLHEKLLDYLVVSGTSKNIELYYNTNLTVLPPKIIKAWSKFKKVNLDVSLDAFGKLNEYIRYPSKWSTIEKNLNELSKISNSIELEVSICTTLQAYNLRGIVDLLEGLKVWRNNFPIIPYFNLLSTPEMLGASVLPLKVKNECIQNINKWIDTHQDLLNCGPYSDKNKFNLQVLKGHLNLISNDNKEDLLFNFITYTKAMDKVRGHDYFSVAERF